jgi:hypothetical protein
MVALMTIEQLIAQWREQGFSDKVIAEALWQRMTQQNRR